MLSIAWKWHVPSCSRCWLKVLVTFLIAVVMAIFAGVKAMIVAGCGQVYVLEAGLELPLFLCALLPWLSLAKDTDVCESALTTLRRQGSKQSTQE